MLIKKEASISGGFSDDYLMCATKSDIDYNAFLNLLMPYISSKIRSAIYFPILCLYNITATKNTPAD